jgi:hypothetical protein
MFVQLRNDGLLEKEDGTAKITDKGVSLIKNVPEEATTRLLEGRAAIREAIKSLSGHSLTDEHYERVWKTLQEELAEVFHSHGARIVRMSGSLLTGESLGNHSTAPNLWESIGVESPLFLPIRRRDKKSDRPLSICFQRGVAKRIIGLHKSVAFT